MDVITTHLNADFDCLGSMVAARRLYPDAAMVFAGAQERSLRELFLSGGADPEEFTRLKDLDLDAIDRIILVDVRQAERIGPFGEIARRPDVDVHIYDHHPDSGDLKGTVEHIEPVGSTVTVLAHLFIERGIVPTPKEATLMMLGLYEDTGSLQFSSTTVKDYLAGAFLLEHGANLNLVADFLTQELTAEQVDLLHQLVQSRTVLNVNGIDISVAHASVDHFIGDLAVLAHKLKDMEGLDALIVLARMGERTFLVGRSRIPEVHVGEILAEFGGGGHRFAAAGAVRDRTLVEMLESLPKVLHEHVRPSRQARELMSFPVKSVTIDTPVGQVRKTLTRYNFNALPVLEGDIVVGIITRQVTEKAAYHGMDGVPVREVMSREFLEVDPSTPVEKLHELLVDGAQRFVPVIEEGKLVGAVTRTDVLRHLISGSQQGRLEEGEASRTFPALKKRDVARLLKDQLPRTIVAMLKEMGEVAEQLGMSVFVVGGFARDLLLRKENFDIDIVVEGDGIAFAEAFARQRTCRIRAHRKFATAVIIFPDGFKVDVASARMEYYMSPGALPQVEHASIKLDLYRRDFTINTLAISLNGPRFGELIDFFGAQRDLKERAIRVLHNLSFVEDPTRVFRAIRFEQRLGFHLGIHTEYLLRSAVRLGFIQKVGGARVFNELVIILREPEPLPAVLRMGELDLLKYIHPELKVDEKTRVHFEAGSRVLHWYELLYTGEGVRRWVVYFLCLTSSLDEEAMQGLCSRLDVPPKVRTLFCESRREALQVLALLEKWRARHTPPRASALYRLLHSHPTEVLLYLMALAATEEVRRWVSHFFTHLRGVKTALNGDDLRDLGYVPGPMFKEILSDLLNARLDGKIATRQDELRYLQEKYRKF